MVICLIPFLPLFIAPSVMYPYVTGKNFAFRIIVGLASVFWIGLIATNKEYRVRSSAIVLSMLIFTFTVGLADLYGINPYRSFWSNYERMEGFITIIHLVLFFLIIKSVFQSKKDWQLLFCLYVVASIFVSLFVIVEPVIVKQASNYLVEYGTRKASTIGNPPFLASYLLLSVFIGLILNLITQQRYLRILCLVSVAINLIVIYMTASRGAIVAAIIGAFIVSFTFLLRRLRNSSESIFKKAISFIIVLSIIVSVSIVVYQQSYVIKNDRTVARFLKISVDDLSIKTRLDAWKVAWNGVVKRPVLGWGQENFIGVYTVNTIPLKGKHISVDRAHNIIVEWLVSAGILGLLSYLAIFGSAFYVLRSNLRKKIVSGNMLLIISTAIIVYFIQNLFTFDTINTYIIIFALMAYIDNSESIHKSSTLDLQENIKFSNSGKKSIIVTLLALIFFTLINYYINYLPVKQLILHSHISRSIDKYKSFSKMHYDFQKALSYRSIGDDHIRDEMTAVSRQILLYELFSKEGALQLIQMTVDELKMGLATNRYNLAFLSTSINFHKLLSTYDPSFVQITEDLMKEKMRVNP